MLAYHRPLSVAQTVSGDARYGTMPVMAMYTAWYSPRQMASWWRCPHPHRPPVAAAACLSKPHLADSY